MKGDFHCHSTFSDGELTVKELFEYAKDKGLAYFSITDHDNLLSINEASKYLNEEIKYIKGIELTTYYKDKPIHLLGYFKDADLISKEFYDYLDFMKNNRKERAKKYIDSLNYHYNLGLDFTSIPSTNGVIARPHIAKVIQEKLGITKDEAFNLYLLDTNKAYIPTFKLSVKEGYELLRKNHAFISLAHPGLTKKEDILEILDLINVDAIEYSHPSHSDEDKKYYYNLAKEKGYLVTAGSDFHRLNDAKHADLATCVLEEKNLELFVSKF